mmetsp:Transcript_27646/g.77470  ORF Transcript_27646/g.77470 Transcript_27646/m.77470 type:complete len:222 (-) Transcript_27646:524-1189(-)
MAIVQGLLAHALRHWRQVGEAGIQVLRRFLLLLQVEFEESHLVGEDVRVDALVEGGYGGAAVVVDAVVARGGDGRPAAGPDSAAGAVGLAPAVLVLHVLRDAHGVAGGGGVPLLLGAGVGAHVEAQRRRVLRDVRHALEEFLDLQAVVQRRVVVAAADGLHGVVAGGGGGRRDLVGGDGGVRGSGRHERLVVLGHGDVCVCAAGLQCCLLGWAVRESFVSW